MYALRLIFLLIMVFLLVFLILQNSQSFVDVYIFSWKIKNAPVFWVMFISFILGSFTTAVLALINELSLKVKLRKKEKEIEKLKMQVEEIKKTASIEERREEIKSQETEEKQGIKGENL